MKGFVLLLVMVGFCQLAMAQASGTITGEVKNESGDMLSFASIILKGTNYGVASDANGAFEFMAPAGNYTLIISEIGFQSINKRITVRSGQTIDMGTVVLKEKESELGEVTVVGERNEYTVDEPSGSLRLNEKLIEVPQNIQVVTAQALEDQQIIDMSDGVLRNVSGATRLEHWGNLYARVNMRGSRAGAFRNGMNVTSNWGPLNEDMSFVETIEFVKGPAGFMMSNGEPSGIYNVVTKKPTGVTRGEVNLTMGNYDLYRGTLDLDGKLSKDGKLLYRLNVMGQTQNSFQDYTFTDRYSVAPVVSYQLDDKTKLTLEYVYQHVNMSNVGSAYVFSTEGYGIYDQSFTIAEPGLDPTKIDDHSVMANLQHDISDNWKVTAQLAYFNYQQEGSSMWLNNVDADGNLLRYVSIWDALNQNAFGQVFVNGEVKTGGVNHRVLAGLDIGTKEYIADWSQSHQLDSINGGFFNMNNPVYGRPVNGLPQFDRSQSLRQRANTSSITQSYSGFYLQDELGFFENALRLTLAGRYTYVNQNSYGAVDEDSRITPRVGLSYSINDQTSVYALYDQAFVPQTGVLKSGEPVKPITGNNMEFGAKREFFNGKWSTGLSLYRIFKNNQMVSDPENPTAQYSLLTQTTTQGVEFDARGEIIPGLIVTANYAYTDSEITDDERTGEFSQVGSPVPGFAKHVANGWLTYSIQSGVLEGLGVSAGFTYQADRTTWNWPGDNQLALPNYFKLDGGLSWENDNLTIRANVFNLLNEYLYSGSAYATYYYYQAEAPRNARLSVGFRF
ncbi:TonB-dependent receptor [Echinicola vietnamensis]|uniref:TonB-dependent siderophore receptor n=1 Tax=Echinicola vietnamensis (strain DSM 17526 / LMG 23754 / KMM 6221) TaxID=926556 RepID=L0G3R2_ECHVK|nr:TonB-dependent receptor [Echinicola vietnamensis]AGA79626.1 TonB-dependent siderophore receptor [Echinicola vietnamensis DSM 17526]